MKNKKILLALILMCTTTPLNITNAMESKKDNNNNNITNTNKDKISNNKNNNISTKNSNKNDEVVLNNKNNNPLTNLNDQSECIKKIVENQKKNLEELKEKHIDMIKEQKKNLEELKEKHIDMIKEQRKNLEELKEKHIDINDKNTNNNVENYEYIDEMIKKLSEMKKNLENEDEFINDKKYFDPLTKMLYELIIIKLVKFYCKKGTICAKEILYGNSNKSTSIKDYISIHQIIMNYLKELKKIEYEKQKLENSRFFNIMRNNKNDELAKMYRELQNSAYTHKKIENYLLNTTINIDQINDIKNKINSQRMDSLSALNLVRKLVVNNIICNNQFSEEITNEFIKKIYEEVNQIYVNLIRIDEFNLKLSNKNNIDDMNILKEKLNTIEKSDFYEKTHIKDIGRDLVNIKNNSDIINSESIINHISLLEDCLKYIYILSLIKQNINLITDNIEFGKAILDKKTKFKDFYKTLMGIIIKNKKKIDKINEVKDKSSEYTKLKNIKDNLKKELDKMNENFKNYNCNKYKIEEILENDIYNKDNNFLKEEISTNEYMEAIKKNSFKLKLFEDNQKINSMLDNNKNNINSELYDPNLEKKIETLKKIEENLNETHTILLYLQNKKTNLSYDDTLKKIQTINKNITKINEELQYIKSINREIYNEEVDKEIQYMEYESKQIYTITLMNEIENYIKKATSLTSSKTEENQDLIKKYDFLEKQIYSKFYYELENIYPLNSLPNHIFKENDKSYKDNMEKILKYEKKKINEKIKNFFNINVTNIKQTLNNEFNNIDNLIKDDLTKPPINTEKKPINKIKYETKKIYGIIINIINSKLNNEKTNNNSDSKDKIEELEKLVKIAEKCSENSEKLLEYQNIKEVNKTMNELDEVDKTIQKIWKNNRISYNSEEKNTHTNENIYFINFFLRYFYIKVKKMQTLALINQTGIYIEQTKQKYSNLISKKNLELLGECYSKIEKIKNNINILKKNNVAFKNNPTFYEEQFIHKIKILRNMNLEKLIDYKIEQLENNFKELENIEKSKIYKFDNKYSDLFSYKLPNLDLEQKYYDFFIDEIYKPITKLKYYTKKYEDRIKKIEESISSKEEKSISSKEEESISSKEKIGIIEKNYQEFQTNLIKDSHNFKSFVEKKTVLDLKIEYYKNTILEMLNYEIFYNKKEEERKIFEEFYKLLCKSIDKNSDTTIKDYELKSKYFLFHLKILYILVNMTKNKMNIPGFDYFSSYIKKVIIKNKPFYLKNDYLINLGKHLKNIKEIKKPIEKEIKYQITVDFFNKILLAANKNEDDSILQLKFIDLIPLKNDVS